MIRFRISDFGLRNTLQYRMSVRDQLIADPRSKIISIIEKPGQKINFPKSEIANPKYFDMTKQSAGLLLKSFRNPDVGFREEDYLLSIEFGQRVQLSEIRNRKSEIQR